VAFVRFTSVFVGSWVIMQTMMDSDGTWTVDVYMPWSFWLLHFLIIFGLIGGGFPFAAPSGLFPKLYEGHWRLIPGVLMSGLVIGMAAVVGVLFHKATGIPWEGGPGAWFGITLFMCTLWFALCMVPIEGVLPLPITNKYLAPQANMLLASPIIIGLSFLIFQVVTYDDPSAPPPIQADDSNPEGPMKGSEWMALAITIIVYVQILANPLVMQGWPFSLLPRFVKQAAVTVACVVLGGITYEVATETCGVDKNILANAWGASAISWSLYHCVAFDFYPFHDRIQPERGFLSLLLSQIVIPFFWVFLLRIVLEPIYRSMVGANPIYGFVFTIDQLIPWFGLHVFAPVLLMHHLFFMRWPLEISGPPLKPDVVYPETKQAAGEMVPKEN